MAYLLSRLPQLHSTIITTILPSWCRLLYSLTIAPECSVLPETFAAAGLDPLTVSNAAAPSCWNILEHLLAFLRERRYCVTHLTALYEELEQPSSTTMTSNSCSLLPPPTAVILTAAVRGVLLGDAYPTARPTAVRILGEYLLWSMPDITLLLVARGVIACLQRSVPGEASAWIPIVRKHVLAHVARLDPACWNVWCEVLRYPGSESEEASALELRREVLWLLLLVSSSSSSTLQDLHVPSTPILLEWVVDPRYAGVAVWIAIRSVKVLDWNAVARGVTASGNDVVPPSKRSKTADGQVAMGSMDDSVLSLLQLALHFDNHYSTERIATVSGALLMLLAQAHSKATYSSCAREICEQLLRKLNAWVEESSLSSMDSGALDQCYALIACGIGVDAMLQRGQILSEIELSSFLDGARRLLTSVADPLTLQLPKELRFAIFAAYNRNDRTAKHVHILGELPVVIDRSSVLLTGVSALCVPVVADEQIQVGRMRYMELSTQADESPSYPIGASMHQKILFLFANRTTSAGIVHQLFLWQSLGWMLITVSPVQLEGTLCPQIPDILQYMVDTALLIDSAVARKYCSREVGKFLAAEDWSLVKRRWTLASSESNLCGVGRLFHYLLHKGPEKSASSELIELYHSCICAQSTTLKSPASIMAVQHSIAGMMRIWGKCADAKERTHCFRLIQTLPWESLRNHIGTMVPAVFKELVVIPVCAKMREHDLNSVPARLWEHRFHCFSKVARLFASHTPGSDVECEESLLTRIFPESVLKFVVERNYDALLLVAGYKSSQRSIEKSSTKSLRRVGESSLPIAGPGLVVFGSQQVAPKYFGRSWTRGVEESLQEYCLTPGVVERLLSMLLREATESDIAFFLSVVLKETLPLEDLIGSQALLVLMNLILYVGKHPSSRTASIKALKRAAAARKKHHDDIAKLLSDAARSSNTSEVEQWVTENFMYLLVNVAQYEWSHRSNKERVQRLRSLSFSLDFVSPTDAPQFFPQILATVNTALDEKPIDSQDGAEKETMTDLYTEATLVLSKFIKLAAPANLDVVGKSLTSVMITLVPILVSDDLGFENPRKISAELLCWLAAGELGEQFVPYFGSLPFVPRCSELQSFRHALNSHGIEIHDLQTGEETCSSLSNNKNDSTGDVSLCGDSLGTSDEIGKQRSLRKRLFTLFSFLSNENTSVRRVVLCHLASLLRSNREIFLNLLCNERWAACDFLTVEFEGAKAADAQNGFPLTSRGLLQEIFGTFLRRCYEENDPDSRVYLAECIGEVGAINSSTNGLDDLEKTDRRQEDAFSSPPWSCRPPYLHLISSHLVVALKSSRSSIEQHKIAFAIQNLLGEMNGPKRIQQDNQTEKKRPEMEPFLVDQLSKAGVFDIVEPFWHSEFKEVSFGPSVIAISQSFSRSPFNRDNLHSLRRRHPIFFGYPTGLDT